MKEIKELKLEDLTIEQKLGMVMHGLFTKDDNWEGFEDNLNLERGVPAKSNGELVAKVVRLAKELGREVATSAEAREILGLKQRS